MSLIGLIMAKNLFNTNYLFLRQMIYPFKRSVSVSKEDIERGSIVLQTDNPFDLFNSWLNEASLYMIKPTPITFTLSNYSPEAKVRSRIFKFVNHHDDTFEFAAIRKTPKVKDMLKYPDVSLLFYWFYPLTKHFVIRQVRMEGTIKELSRPETEAIFQKHPLPLQVEIAVSHQGLPVEDWAKKQSEFLERFNSVKNGRIDLPDYVTALSVTVKEIQFFHNITRTEPFFIADRIKFTKHKDTWKPQRIAP